MVRRPEGRWVRCPDCGSETVAILPSDAVIVQDRDDAGGKVWVYCRECEARFLVFYRTKPDGPS